MDCSVIVGGKHRKLRSVYGDKSTCRPLALHATVFPVFLDEVNLLVRTATVDNLSLPRSPAPKLVNASFRTMVAKVYLTYKKYFYDFGKQKVALMSDNYTGRPQSAACLVKP